MLTYCTIKDPDPHGQAALMLCECLTIMLVQQGVPPRQCALDAIQNTIEVKRQIAGVTESVVMSIASIGLFGAVAQSVSAVTLPVKRSEA